MATDQSPMRTGKEAFAIPVDGERHQEGIRPDHSWFDNRLKKAKSLKSGDAKFRA